MSLRVLEWGRTEYAEALARQEEIYRQRLAEEVPDTMHGLALNVLDRQDGFRFINPCGIKGCTMTSMEKQ